MYRFRDEKLSVAEGFQIVQCFDKEIMKGIFSMPSKEPTRIHETFILTLP